MEEFQDSTEGIPAYRKDKEIPKRMRMQTITTSVTYDQLPQEEDVIRPNWGNMNYDDIAEPGEDADGGYEGGDDEGRGRRLRGG